MSDCSTNANGPYDVARLRIEFEGEEIPWMYPLALNGRVIKGVFVGNERYVPERECAPTIEPWKSDVAKFDAYCGNCGCEIGDKLMRLPNYCPHCGARVKEGGDD